MEQLLITAAAILFAPAALGILLVVVLASVGQSVGIRKKYVQVLLKIFEYGRQKIEHKQGFIQDSAEEQTGKELGEDGHAGEEDKKAPSGNGCVQSEESGMHVIEREMPLRASEGIRISNVRSVETMQREFQLTDTMYFCKSGVEAIIEDEVTKCFSSEELPSWNLLSRTNNNYQYLSVRLTVLWGLGVYVRYLFLLPFRIILAVIGIAWLIISTAFIGYLPKNRFKKILNQYVSLMCYRILCRAFSAVITFHNSENKAKGGGICVANHTSPIDVMVLATDNCYAMVGQSHGGFLGLLQRALSRATSHIWFERSEVRDRSAVARRLQEHVSDPENLPVLIFPEGTCINNTSVMMFKKGSFEVGCTIFPIAIKYDLRFADTFWNSSKQGMVKHILMMMSSWAIVCDVWYLPPVKKREDENAIQFANRVKQLIAQAGGLVDLEWDGQLKRTKPKPDMIQKQQQHYSKLLKHD